MIPNLTLMVAAYVIFRAIEVVAKLGPGGEYEKSPVVLQGLLALCVVGLIVVAVYTTMDTWERGAEATKLLTDVMPPW